jgi:uncharacterized membrane protein YphA (DoxX/SURF4 family)
LAKDFDLQNPNFNASMTPYTDEKKIYYTLRLATAMCFIGHGVFGIITKPIWCNYFALFGIGHDLAYHLMPVLGSFDILLGIFVLVYPMGAIPAWLVFWGVVTALMRPLSGEPFAEFIERAGNFGAPLALLVLFGPHQRALSSWLKPLDPSRLPEPSAYHRSSFMLRATVFLLFLGHGWLNLLEKKGLIDSYQRIGFSDPHQIAHIIGILEITAAILVVVKPMRSLLLVLFIWKMASELFYPHYELVEWVERGGSYGSILALWLVLGREANLKPSWVNPKDVLGISK